MDKQKVVIFGDSYSTYEGYIPKNYNCYYNKPKGNNPILSGVEQTWWKILANEMGYDIVLNDSYSGAIVCNAYRDNYPIQSSFISRADKYISQDFFKITTLIGFLYSVAQTILGLTCLLGIYNILGLRRKI